MEVISGIYKITSPSGKIYIGQSKNILYRWKYHYKTKRCECQRYLYNSLCKHGFENHKLEIIHKSEMRFLNYLEMYYIAYYNSFNSKDGLNLRSGGKVNTITEETRLKMSIAKKGKKVKNRKPISEEARIHLSEIRKGKKLTEEHKLKIGLAGKGRKNSPETIEKMKNVKKDMSTFSRKLINIETMEIYPSVAEAARQLNIPVGSIYSYFNRGTNEKIKLKNYYE